MKKKELEERLLGLEHRLDYLVGKIDILRDIIALRFPSVYTVSASTSVEFPGNNGTCVPFGTAAPNGFGDVGTGDAKSS